MRTLSPGTNKVLQFVFLVAILASCSGLTWASGGQLKWSVGFGQVRVGQSRSQSVVFTNTGTGSLAISKYVTNAAGFAVSGLTLPFSLAAGQSTSLEIVFQPQSAGNVNGDIVFYSNALNSVLTINVNGKGVTCGTLSETLSNISFAPTTVGTSSTKYENLSNSSTCDIVVSKLDVSGSDFRRSSMAVPFTLKAGQSVTFGVIFTPQTTGTAAGDLSILSSAVDSKLVTALSGTGVAPGTLNVTPASENFGNVVVGQSKNLSATLTASGGLVTVNSAAVNGSEFQLSGLSLPLTLAAGQSKSFAVTFTPKATGSAAATLSLAGIVANGPVLESLAGVGVSPPAHSVTLSWSETSSGVAGYNVYRASQSSGPFVKLNAALDSNKSYVDSSVLAGHTYYYVVTAVSGGVESPRSSQVTAIIPTP